MLTLYDYLDSILEENKHSRWLNGSRMNYLASEIMKSLEITDAMEIESALKRTFYACSVLQIPFDHNFEKIYCVEKKQVKDDWKISPFACYLLIINCNPKYRLVAKAQLYFAMERQK
ncbi:MAG TPA: hypothetical protein VLB84_20775 [Bacteroidia bacterium]|nr:hypothetical protein [Bacteroidia bacterium]